MSHPRHMQLSVAEWEYYTLLENQTLHNTWWSEFTVQLFGHQVAPGSSKSHWNPNNQLIANIFHTHTAPPACEVASESKVIFLALLLDC